MVITPGVRSLSAANHCSKIGRTISLLLQINAADAAGAVIDVEVAGEVVVLGAWAS